MDTKGTSSLLVWFRRDLRLDDNSAFMAAVRRAEKESLAVVPIYVWSPEEEAPWEPGAATKWWLDRSLRALGAELESRGSRFILRRGPALKSLRDLVKETQAVGVYWNRCYEPAIRARDEKIKTALSADGLHAESFNGSLLKEPWELKTGGGPYQVYGPYWKAFVKSEDVAAPVPAPKSWPSPKRWPVSLTVADFKLEPIVDWDAGLRATWEPGEAAARAALNRFVKQGVANYETERDRPDHVGTSRLSAALHFGELSPRRAWHSVSKVLEAKPLRSATEAVQESGELRYLKELVWREFAHHLLFHFPHTDRAPLRSAFEKFPWKRDAKLIRAWQRGQTGYPIVDAGMRELWTTGWMHNRVRMIVASFLVKHLLQSWQAGAEWFWDTLVDADLANNTFGWQWTAGCGADASPYFRIFNPVLQGTRFDPEGDYVRKWVPELAKLPKRIIHKPWESDAASLAASGLVLGKNYPHPIVDHNEARMGALRAYGKIKK